MSTYDNFLQFACQKDGATRRTQITQLIASNWEVHDVDNPLVVMHLNIINAFCSVSTLREPRLRSGSLMTYITIFPLDEVIPFINTLYYAGRHNLMFWPKGPPRPMTTGT